MLTPEELVAAVQRERDIDAAKAGLPRKSALSRGTVLRKYGEGEHFEAGIVLGPSPFVPGAVEVVHGWIDNPPDAGTFDLPADTMMCGGRWRVATDEEAAIVRELFLEHARKWGPDSKAWVAQEISADGM